VRQDISHLSFDMLSRQVLLVLSGVLVAVRAAAFLPTPTAAVEDTIYYRRQTAATATPTVTSSPSDGSFTSTEHIIISGFTNAYATVPDKTIDLTLETCVRTAVPDANGHVPPGTCGAIWTYYPSYIGAAAFAVMFGMITGVHIWQAAAKKKANTIHTRNQSSSV
jgi:hypothetical protein